MFIGAETRSRGPRYDCPSDCSSRAERSFRSKLGDKTMDHSTHIRHTAAELVPSVLEGATIYGPDDENIGSVSHVH